MCWKEWMINHKRLKFKMLITTILGNCLWGSRVKSCQLYLIRVHTTCSCTQWTGAQVIHVLKSLLYTMNQRVLSALTILMKIQHAKTLIMMKVMIWFNILLTEKFMVSPLLTEFALPVRRLVLKLVAYFLPVLLIVKPRHLLKLMGSLVLHQRTVVKLP